MKKLTYVLLFMCILLIGCTNKIIDFDIVDQDITIDIQEFDIHNHYINLKYSNGTTKMIHIEESMISSIDLEKLNEVGTYDIQINYEGISKLMHINLITKPISFEVDMSSVNTDIKQFNIEDIKLILTYSNGTKQTINCTEDMISESNLEKLSKLGYHQFYINYQELYQLVEITIVKHINIRFICDDEVIYEETIKVGDHLKTIPNVKAKENYTGEWNITDFDNLEEDTDVVAIYTYDQELLFEEAKAELLKTYTDINISSNINLMKNYQDIKISWKSEYISKDGSLTRPYQKTTSNLEATLFTNTKEEKITIPVTIEGYKSLDNGIASNYIYRYYNKVTNEYFETMDIIYCAFIEIDTNGGFTGRDADNNSIANSNARVKQNINTYIMPKAKEQGIYVIASLGGGGAAPRDTFKAIASDENLRKTFASNIVKLINDFGFDGVDLDWETPTTQEKTNFTLLVEEIHKAVKKNNPHHFVTAAIGGGKWQPPRYDLENSGKYLDYINIMTYGMCSESGYYQNALYPSSVYHNQEIKVGKTLTSCSIEESKTIFLNMNIPLSKMIFGLAFYGVKQTLENGTWGGGGSIMYPTIKSYESNSNYTAYYDEIAQVPYLLSNDKTIFISYDNPKSIKAKCKYVLDNHMAGVMLWENGCDTTGELVHAIKEGLKNQ